METQRIHNRDITNNSNQLKIINHKGVALGKKRRRMIINWSSWSGAKKNKNHSPASSVVASCKAARPSPCIEMVPAAQQSWQGKLAQICGKLVLDYVHHLTAIEKTRSQTMRQARCLRFKSIKNCSLAQTCCVRCWREWRSSTTRVCVHYGWDTHSSILGLSTCDGGSPAQSMSNTKRNHRIWLIILCFLRIPQDKKCSAVCWIRSHFSSLSHSISGQPRKMCQQRILNVCRYCGSG